mgnify:CR=1 FL=1
MQDADCSCHLEARRTGPLAWRRRRRSKWMVWWNVCVNGSYWHGGRCSARPTAWAFKVLSTCTSTRHVHTRTGTGDAQINLGQRIPLSGAALVSTPQDVALIDVRRCALRVCVCTLCACESFC